MIRPFFKKNYLSIIFGLLLIAGLYFISLYSYVLYHSFVELFMDQQHVQIDLEGTNEIYAIVLWHNHDSPVIYRDVIVQVSNDPECMDSVTTVFNNDEDDSAGIGTGTDIEYVETYEGKLIPVKGVKGRYVRLYSTGNTCDEMNRYVEVEIWCKSPGTGD